MGRPAASTSRARSTGTRAASVRSRRSEARTTTPRAGTAARGPAPPGSGTAASRSSRSKSAHPAPSTRGPAAAPAGARGSGARPRARSDQRAPAAARTRARHARGSQTGSSPPPRTRRPSAALPRSPRGRARPREEPSAGGSPGSGSGPGRYAEGRAPGIAPGRSLESSGGSGAAASGALAPAGRPSRGRLPVARAAPAPGPQPCGAEACGGRPRRAAASVRRFPLGAAAVRGRRRPAVGGDPDPLEHAPSREDAFDGREREAGVVLLVGQGRRGRDGAGGSPGPRIARTPIPGGGPRRKAEPLARPLPVSGGAGGARQGSVLGEELRVRGGSLVRGERARGSALRRDGAGRPARLAQDRVPVPSLPVRRKGGRPGPGPGGARAHRRASGRGRVPRCSARGRVRTGRGALGRSLGGRAGGLPSGSGGGRELERAPRPGLRPVDEELGVLERAVLVEDRPPEGRPAAILGRDRLRRRGPGGAPAAAGARAVGRRGRAHVEAVMAAAAPDARPVRGNLRGVEAEAGLAPLADDDHARLPGEDAGGATRARPALPCRVGPPGPRLEPQSAGGPPRGPSARPRRGGRGR